MVKNQKGVLIVLLAWICVVPMAATPLSGTFNGAGSASVTLTTISFSDTTNAPNLFDIAAPLGGSFAGITLPAKGTIQNLNQGSEPVNTPLTVHNWLTVTAAGAPANIDYELTYVGGGGGGACTVSS